jgi:biopolymer transport protein ExbB/TolQ
LEGFTVTILTYLFGLKTVSFLAFLLQQQAGAGGGEQSAASQFTISEMIRNLGPVAIGVIVILLIMSMYSIAIMVERYLTYSAARKQSREFAPRVAQALKNDRLEEAINISDKHKKSHLAMVVNAGLQEFRAHGQSPEISGEEIEASKRALQRAIAVKSAEFRRGLSGLATIGSTAPFVGLFGTVFGIIAAFQGMKNAETAGIGAVAGGISEALFTTALGLAVAVPAVWVFNYFTGKVDGFVVEMENSASELVDYFIKNRTRQLKS